MSVDGTWLKRGHVSNIGVVCAIDLLTNICVDYHVLSKFCQKCATVGAKIRKERGQHSYQRWFAAHADKCEKNFDGSSGMMEVEGAKVLFGRSLALHNMQYTTMLSDGDSKAYNEVCQLKPYGDAVEITKEECVNHVAKRMGTALRNLVSDNSKRGVRLGGKGGGKLTQTTIGKLQEYYEKAIRTNTDSVGKKWSKLCGPVTTTVGLQMRLHSTIYAHLASARGVFSIRT